MENLTCRKPEAESDLGEVLEVQRQGEQDVTALEREPIP